MKSRIATAAVVLVGALALAFQSGCVTPTHTARQNARLHQRLLQREMLMLAEDINTFWMMDHPTSLSKWHYK